jgi:hypothetical protein
MSQKGTPLFFSLFAVLALLLTRGLPAPGPAATATQPAPPGRPEATQPAEAQPVAVKPGAADRFKEPLRLYREFFGDLGADGKGCGAVAAPAGAPELRPVLAGAACGDYRLEFLIALVPDPLDSHLAYRFDEASEGIQQAFAARRYLFDRSYLPWQDKPADHLYRQVPGVLLFRWAGLGSDHRYGRRLATVLLVGETPKGGIKKEAFQAAVALVEALQRPGEPVRVLGPSFSGSVESLRVALRREIPGLGREGGPGAAAPSAAPRFAVTTGTATAKGLEEVFDRNFGRAVAFHRAVVPDDELQRTAFDFLEKRMGWALGDIALLSESDTAYGNQPFKITYKGGDRGTDRGSGFLQAEFPSHLSHIRSAWTKSAPQKSAHGQAPLVEPAPKNLSFDFTGEDEPADVVPEWSPLTTTSSDLGLSNLLTEICGERVRYIGIVATDIQDRLFLAEHVRSFCPDIVLFSLDSHLLDAHPQLARAMDGMLVFSNFPLFVEKQRSHRQQFTSEFQQGTFVAAGALLDGGELPSTSVWVSAVGNGKLWPIAQLPQWTDRRAFGTGKTDAKWLFAGAALAALAAWLWFTARPLQEATALSPAGSWTWDAHWLGGLGAVALWLAGGVLATFFALPLWDPDRIFPWTRARSFNLVALALVYAGLTWTVAQLTRRPGRRHGAGSWVLWSAAGLLLLGLLGPAMFRLWVAGQVEYFYARTGDFSSGLSPLVPFALLGAAVYAWALIEVKRHRLMALQGLEWPLAEPTEPPLADCGEMAAGLDRTLARRLPHWKFLAGLSVALALPVRRLAHGIQPIAEPAGGGWVFLSLAVLAFVLSAFSFHRFFAAWRRLEAILDRTCHTWLLRAFKEGAAAFDWKPMKSFGWRMPTFKMSVLSAQQLKVVAGLGSLGEAEGDDGGLSARVDDDLRRAFAAEREDRLHSEIALRHDLRRRFAAAVGRLERLRLELGGAEPPPALADPAEKTALELRRIELQEIEKFLALRVVTYVRYVFAHLRYCLAGAMFSGLFLLFGVTAYAFEPKRYVSFGVWAALLAASAMTLWAFVQMDKNGALSEIGGTTAGTVSLDRTFFGNLLKYGAVPVLGVVVTQFPAVSSLFGDWLSPLLRVLGAG